ncbi:hypothetical protein D3C73_816820 [compost metagenome]
MRLGKQVEEFAGQVLRRARAGRREVHRFLGVGLPQSDQVGHRLHFIRGRDDQHVGHAQQQRDRCKGGQRVELHLGMQRGILRVVGGVQHQGVAVGLRLGHDRAADHAARAAPVFNHHGLAQFGGQLRADQAGDHVHGAARRIRHDQRDGALGIGRRCGAGGACQQARRHQRAATVGESFEE